jgi:drug/metabolite transporter (DMT)-like permease
MNFALFLITTLIWGSTWLAIQYQLGVVSPFWSLVYRFGFAAFILITYCLYRQESLSFNQKQHTWIAIQAFFMFFLNYVLFYLASSYFVSGIIATIFAILIVMNIVNSRIFLKNSIDSKTIAGAIIGIFGLIFVVWSEITRLENKDIWVIFEGLALSLGATLSASLGQIVFIKNLKRGLPVIQINALGYVYGSFFTLLLALILGHTPTIDWTWPYMSSLVYLSFFGTVIAFLAYLTLAKRIGPEKSAYAFVLLPIVAMALSSLFEDLTWTTQTITGMALVLLGNVLVMAKKLPTWRLRKIAEVP